MLQTTELDAHLSGKVAICADPNTTWQKLRLSSRILEATFHGVPWLIITSGAILRSQNMEQATFNINLLAGKQFTATFYIYTSTLAVNKTCQPGCSRFAKYYIY